jgi:hypothetical protein
MVVVGGSNNNSGGPSILTANVLNKTSYSSLERETTNVTKIFNNPLY